MKQSNNSDALIKKGQMEMAKGAFKTQLEVLEKVHPEQAISFHFQKKILNHF